MKNLFAPLALAASLGSLLLSLQPAPAQSTAFTYQGLLNDGGSRANGSFDLTFTLFNTKNAGVAIAGPVTNSATAVSNGLFVATLDFGSVFDGSNYWLEIAVRTNGAGAFATLSPRQPVTPAPQALYAAGAGNAATAMTAATAASANSVSAANIVGAVSLAQLPPTLLTNNQNGVTLSGIFSGDGSALANLNPTNLSAGTANISIAGNAATATTATNLTGNVADSQLSTNVALLNGTNSFTGTNSFAGVTSATNANNLFSGTFTGNLAGNAATATSASAATTASNFSGVLAGDVTGTQGATVVGAVGGQSAAVVASGAVAAKNATSANAAGTIVARDASGNFSASAITANSFSGNGGGLTNLPAASLTGTLADSQLSSNIARLNIPNTATQATGGVVIAAGFIIGAYVTNAGSGYTAVPSVTVTDVSGSNALITAAISGGSVVSLAVQVAGSHYSAGATLTIVPPPSNAYQTFSSGNIFAGVNTFNNATNTFAGSFTGNGNGLTNLSAASLTIPPGMALIPAGAFAMGNSVGDSDITDAGPISVTVSALYMDVNPVSYSQWQSVYFWATSHGYGFVNAGAGKAPSHPVQTVNWYDAVKWCNARSQQAGKTPVYYTDAGLTQVYTSGQVDAVYPNWTASGYRLPTEAEWEKAARGGLSGQRFPWGNTITENLANYYGNTSISYDLGPNGNNAIGSVGGTAPATSPVGSFAPNGYGLCDMAGNVWAWCWDWYGTPYAGGSDPRGPVSGINRVLRGGVWDGGANYTRCGYRLGNTPNAAYSDHGFRCVRGL